MYGDGSSPYIGLGRDLHRIAPSVHEFVQRATTAMWGAKHDTWNPRGVLHEAMEADGVECVIDSGGEIEFVGLAKDLRRLLDALAHCHARVKCIVGILEDHLHQVSMPPQTPSIQHIDAGPFEPDRALHRHSIASEQL